MRPDSLDVADCHGDGPPLAEALADQDLPFDRLEELMCLSQAIRDLSGAGAGTAVPALFL